MFDEIVMTGDFVNDYLKIISDMPMPGIEESAKHISELIKRDFRIIQLEKACKYFMQVHLYTCDCFGCKIYRNSL